MPRKSAIVMLMAAKSGGRMARLGSFLMLFVSGMWACSPLNAASSAESSTQGSSQQSPSLVTLASNENMTDSGTAEPKVATDAGGAANAQNLQSEAIIIEVDKSHLVARLSTLPEDPSKTLVLDTFPIAIGKGSGDKVTEGDNRTPEGVFFTREHIDGERLPAKYGPWAIPLDYPNAFDQSKQRTGHGIWLHGVEAEDRIRKERVTEGCVAFHNADIARLRQWLPARQAIVAIADDLSKVNQPQEVEEVKKATLAWIDDWKNRRTDRYADYYDAGFSHTKGHRLVDFVNYKKALFARYRKMSVGIADLRVVTHPKYALAVMNQDFRGDRFVSRGRKVLYWARKPQSGGWRILREVFDPIPFRKRAFSRDELALLSSKASANAKQNPTASASSL